MREEPRLALLNETTGIIIAQTLNVATRLLPRFLGLMGRTDFSEDAALGLSQCDWVHTFLVKFPLDLVYCDEQGCVLAVISNLRPNHVAARLPGAFWAYEMHRGRLARHVSVGDRLRATAVTVSSQGRA